MARFYDGQPVVCVWTPEQWDPVLLGFERYKPVLGARYVILASRGRVECGLGHVPDAVSLVEFGPAIIFNEEGFAPVTDGQVRGMIERATKLPGKGDDDQWIVDDKERQDA